MCVVNQVGVVDRLLNTAPPTVTDETALAGAARVGDQQVNVDPIACYYLCDEQDAALDAQCEVGKFRGGYGYCAQLNVSFEVTETISVSQVVDWPTEHNCSNSSFVADDGSYLENASNASYLACVDEWLTRPPPPPAPPPVEEAIVKNTTCPVTIPTVTLTQDISTAMASDKYKLTYDFPEFYPGYAAPSTEEEVAEMFLAWKQAACAGDAECPDALRFPHNKSYFFMNFKGCFSSDGYTCVTLDPEGKEQVPYMEASCSFVDCRASVREAEQALELHKQLYESYRFPCEYMPTSASSASMMLNALGTPIASLLDGVTVYPVFVTREFPLMMLVGYSLGIALTMCLCYSCCYFLCCREWWCQFEYFQRWQYF